MLLALLGCDDSFGMENGTIADSQIKATSVNLNYFAQNARLNSRNAWCAGSLDKNQYIQVKQLYSNVEINQTRESC